MPLSWKEIRDRAHHFVAGWQDTAEERAEAQSFWNAWDQGLSRGWGKWAKLAPAPEYEGRPSKLAPGAWVGAGN